MTNTEQRLADALHTVARGVHEETLPALEAPRPSPRRRWAIRLAPAFAAAGVALAVAISLLAVHSTPPVPVTLTTGLPAHYAVLTVNSVQIRTTGTGALTATVRPPRSYDYSETIAAAPGGGKFFVAFQVSESSFADQTALYSFEITSSGHVTGFAPVKNGTLDGQIESMAVSPDGSRLAFSSIRVVRTGSGRTYEPMIEIMSLATGARQQWQGRLDRDRLYTYLPSVTWEGRDGPLVFLAQWCSGTVSYGLCTSQPAAEQVRTLNLADSGSLTHGSVLFSSSASYPYIQAAVLGDGGSSLILTEMTGLSKSAPGEPKSFELIRVPLRPSGSAQVFYRVQLNGNRVVPCVQPDAARRHLLMAEPQNGWLDHGRLHLLPPQQHVAFCDAW